MSYGHREFMLEIARLLTGATTLAEQADRLRSREIADEIVANLETYAPAPAILVVAEKYANDQISFTVMHDRATYRVNVPTHVATNYQRFQFPMGAPIPQVEQRIFQFSAADQTLLNLCYKNAADDMEREAITDLFRRVQDARMRMDGAI